MARYILAFYIEDLRDWERQDEAEDSFLALDVLRREAQHSPDVMLQSQLYQLAGVQIEMAKAATAQSDFAFKEIQAPAVADRPYSL